MKKLFLFIGLCLWVNLSYGEPNKNIIFKRDFVQTIQGVWLPEHVKDAAVYEIVNGKVDPSKEVPAVVKTTDNGKALLLVQVPAISRLGTFHSIIIKDDKATLWKKDIGSTNFELSIVCNQKANKDYSDLFTGKGLDLVYNGGFELKNEKTDWPVGWELDYQYRIRENCFWVSDVSHQGKYSMKINQTAKFCGMLNVYFRTDADQKYEFSSWIKTEITDKRKIRIDCNWFDANKVLIPGQSVMIFASNESFDWRKIEKVITAPKNAAYGHICFSISSKNHTLFVDDVKVVPVDIPSF